MAGDTFSWKAIFMTQHVHNRECDKIATFRFVHDAVQQMWSIGASCGDTEESLRAHLARSIPEAEFLSVSVTSARTPLDGAALEFNDLTRQQVEEKLGPPRKAVQTPKNKLWVYYYDEVEVYFGLDDVVEWIYELSVKNRAAS